MIYRDERGEIADIAEGDFKSLQLITSKKGSIRSNHFHKTGGHLLYVLSGSMRYVEKQFPFISEKVVSAGESVFTGPQVPHACEFLEDTVLICGSTLPRSAGAYEADTVKVKVL